MTDSFTVCNNICFHHNTSLSAVQKIFVLSRWGFPKMIQRLSTVSENPCMRVGTHTDTVANINAICSQCHATTSSNTNLRFKWIMITWSLMSTAHPLERYFLTLSYCPLTEALWRTLLDACYKKKKRKYLHIQDLFLHEVYEETCNWAIFAESTTVLLHGAGVSLEIPLYY